MNGSGDKMVTTREPDLLSAQKSKAQQKGHRGKPAALVKFGSAAVPVYRITSGKRVRFTISYHRDGKRLRQVFPSFDAAKKEAQLVAQRIQSGSHNLHRRHLDESQRAMAAARIANLHKGANQHASIDAPYTQPAAAEMLNVAAASIPDTGLFHDALAAVVSAGIVVEKWTSTYIK